METLLGSSIPALEQGLRFHEARQGILAANLANADTPGYRRVDLRFEGELGRARASLLRTHPAHRAGLLAPEREWRVAAGPLGSRPDRNGVELGREVVSLARNGSAFRQQAAVLARLIAMRRVAVAGNAG